MDQESASQVANRLCQRDGDRPEREAQRMRDAAFYIAYDLIPDGAATACVLLGEQSEPTIVALDGQQLYLLTVPPPGEVPVATGKLRMIHIAPGTGTMELDTRYTGREDRPAREATWHFELEGLSLTLETQRDHEQHQRGDWELAETLAVALGWKFSQDG